MAERSVHPLIRVRTGEAIKLQPNFRVESTVGKFQELDLFPLQITGVGQGWIILERQLDIFEELQKEPEKKVHMLREIPYPGVITDEGIKTDESLLPLFLRLSFPELASTTAARLRVEAVYNHKNLKGVVESPIVPRKGTRANAEYYRWQNANGIIAPIMIPPAVEDFKKLDLFVNIAPKSDVKTPNFSGTPRLYLVRPPL